MVPANGTGNANPPASGGIVDSPDPLMVSTVWLPKPIRMGAALTTVAPLKITPVENLIMFDPAFDEGPAGPSIP